MAVLLLIPWACHLQISSMMTFRRLYMTCSLCLRRQQGPYRSSSPCTDGPPPKPTVHSLHSCGTVEIARESSYEGSTAANGGGDGGGIGPGLGEAATEWKDPVVTIDM